MSKPTGMSDVEWGLRCDLAAAFRLSVRFGFNEGLGNHFSLMLPGHDDRFLVNARGLLFQEITANNLLVVDFKGNVGGAKSARSRITFMRRCMPPTLLQSARSICIRPTSPRLR